MSKITEQEKKSKEAMITLTRNAFLDGMSSAFQLVKDQIDQIEKQGVSSKIADGYIKLWLEKVEGLKNAK